MAMNIKDPETERMVAKVAEAEGMSKTAVIREAVRERCEKVLGTGSVEEREARLERFMAEEIWPLIPEDQLGVPISKEEREDILGFGPDGV